MFDSFRPHGLYSLWNSPGQNTGVGSLSLLQGIFPTQGLNSGLPHCRWILYQLNHQGSPVKLNTYYFKRFYQMNGDCFSTKRTLSTPNSKLYVLCPGKGLKDWDKRSEYAVPMEVWAGKDSEYVGLYCVLSWLWVADKQPLRACGKAGGADPCPWIWEWVEMRCMGVSIERTPMGCGRRVTVRKWTAGSGTWEAEAGVRNGEPECGGL